MHKMKKLLPMLAFLLAGATSVHAQVNSAPATPGQELHKTPPKQGWFWYRDPVEEKKKDPPTPVEVAPVPVEPAKPAAPVVIVAKSAKKELTPEEREKLCKSKDTWEKVCGFIDPGDDFEFQAKQRDILLQMMSLTPDNPDSVEQAQRYMKWVVGKASMAANMWYFNMVQNPELDPTVKNPISEVGIALASRITQASQFEYFRLIKEEGGTLFYFTRSDCSFCFDQSQYAVRVARTMGLDIVNIPLDGKCLPDFTGLACGDNVKPEDAAVLDVKIVPALYLHVPANTWIRLGTGVMTDQTILANTVNFFSAYRAAMLQGLDNSKGARPTVSFDQKFNEKPTGTVSADGAAAPNGLDRGRMMELMGYGNQQKK
jgi:hypothetical protein